MTERILKLEIFAVVGQTPVFPQPLQNLHVFSGVVVAGFVILIARSEAILRVLQFAPS